MAVGRPRRSCCCECDFFLSHANSSLQACNNRAWAWLKCTGFRDMDVLHKNVVMLIWMFYAGGKMMALAPSVWFCTSASLPPSSRRKVCDVQFFADDLLFHYDNADHVADLARSEESVLDAHRGMFDEDEPWRLLPADGITIKHISEIRNWLSMMMFSWRHLTHWRQLLQMPYDDHGAPAPPCQLLQHQLMFYASGLSCTTLCRRRALPLRRRGPRRRPRPLRGVCPGCAPWRVRRGRALAPPPRRRHHHQAHQMIFSWGHLKHRTQLLQMPYDHGAPAPPEAPRRLLQHELLFYASVKTTAHAPSFWFCTSASLHRAKGTSTRALCSHLIWLCEGREPWIEIQGPPRCSTSPPSNMLPRRSCAGSLLPSNLVVLKKGAMGREVSAGSRSTMVLSITHHLICCQGGLCYSCKGKMWLRG